jgi:hypothetical protein
LLKIKKSKKYAGTCYDQPVKTPKEEEEHKETGNIIEFKHLTDKI